MVGVENLSPKTQDSRPKTQDQRHFDIMSSTSNPESITDEINLSITKTPPVAKTVVKTATNVSLIDSIMAGTIEKEDKTTNRNLFYGLPTTTFEKQATTIQVSKKDLENLVTQTAFATKWGDPFTKYYYFVGNSSLGYSAQQFKQIQLDLEDIANQNCPIIVIYGGDPLPNMQQAGSRLTKLLEKERMDPETQSAILDSFQDKMDGMTMTNIFHAAREHQLSSTLQEKMLSVILCYNIACIVHAISKYPNVVTVAIQCDAYKDYGVPEFVDYVYYYPTQRDRQGNIIYGGTINNRPVGTTFYVASIFGNVRLIAFGGGRITVDEFQWFQKKGYIDPIFFDMTCADGDPTPMSAYIQTTTKSLI